MERHASPLNGEGMSSRYSKDLRTLSPEDPAYWEELLRREGLTEDAGRDHRLEYVGNSKSIQALEEKIVSGREGPKTTLNFGPKDSEIIFPVKSVVSKPRKANKRRN